MGDADLRSALTALDVAIQTEKDGLEFYRRAAERTSDPGGKVLFASLADDELEHLRLLEPQREALTRDGHWLPRSKTGEEAHPTKVEGAPIFSREAVGVDINSHTSDLSALRMAFLIEKDAVAFYTKAAAETEDENGRAMTSAWRRWRRSTSAYWGRSTTSWPRTSGALWALNHSDPVTT